MRRLISGISKMNCRMCIRSLLTCMHGNITNTPLCHVIQLELLCKVVIIFKVNLTCRIDCHYLSINSSDKHKCYELIKKLSAIYHSDKEYLKVCALKCVQFKLHHFFFFFYCNSLMSVYVQFAKLWLQHLLLKEEEAADKRELLQLWQEMAQVLLDCLSEEEPESEIQQHVSCPQM